MIVIKYDHASVTAAISSTVKDSSGKVLQETDIPWTSLRGLKDVASMTINGTESKMLLERFSQVGKLCGDILIEGGTISASSTEHGIGRDSTSGNVTIGDTADPGKKVIVDAVKPGVAAFAVNNFYGQPFMVLSLPSLDERQGRLIIFFIKMFFGA